MDNDDTYLAHLANQLRDAFRRKKSVVDRKPYRPHKRFDDGACWLRTAKLVQRMKANPEDFIEAQFRFSRSCLFANTLHGPTAEKRYRHFVALSAGLTVDKEEKIDLESTPTPGKAELLGRIANAMSLIQANTKSNNFLNQAAKAFVLERPWLFDALSIMILAGQDPDYQREFGQRAEETLLTHSYLRTAAEELNLSLEPVYAYINSKH